jgi:hypothetical protein
MDVSFWSAVVAGWASFLAAALTVVLGVYGIYCSFRTPAAPGAPGGNISKHGMVGLVLVGIIIILTAYGSWKSTRDTLVAENEATLQKDKLDAAKKSIDQAQEKLNLANSDLAGLMDQTTQLADKMERLKHPLVVSDLELNFKLKYADADMRLPKLYQRLAKQYATATGAVDTMITGDWELTANDNPSHMLDAGIVWIVPIADKGKDSQSVECSPRARHAVNAVGLACTA